MVAHVRAHVRLHHRRHGHGLAHIVGDAALSCGIVLAAHNLGETAL
jgi:hypothetical protein